MRLVGVVFVIGSLCGAASLPASESAPGMTKCTMTFTLKGWSAVYKTAAGYGQIVCANGESSPVRISITGGGLTFGKTEILDGRGVFSRVKGIEEAFGDYVAAEAHAGAVKSYQAAAYTKGEVSLAVTGTGRGVDVGIDFGALKITKDRK